MAFIHLKDVDSFTQSYLYNWKTSLLETVDSFWYSNTMPEENTNCLKKNKGLETWLAYKHVAKCFQCKAWWISPVGMVELFLSQGNNTWSNGECLEPNPILHSRLVFFLYFLKMMKKTYKLMQFDKMPRLMMMMSMWSKMPFYAVKPVL